jgi:hypothetical protein
MHLSDYGRRRQKSDKIFSGALYLLRPIVTDLPRGAPPSAPLKPLQSHLQATSGGVTELEGNDNDLKESSGVQAVVDWFGPTDFLHIGDAESDLQHNAPDSPESRLIPMEASAGADALPVPALRLHPGQGIIMVASGWSCSPARGRRSRWWCGNARRSNSPRSCWPG